MQRSYAELKRSAPRTFDKELLDLLVLIQSGGQPIVVDSADAARIAALADENAALMARIAKLEASVQYLARHAIEHIHTGPNGQPMAFVETGEDGEVVRLVADSRKPLVAA